MSQDYLDKLIEKDETGTQIQSIPLHDTELRGITIDEPITVEGNPINFSTQNEQNAIQTEMDAVKKVISKNVESSFKTFNA
jgi:hypothetical protein